MKVVSVSGASLLGSKATSPLVNVTRTFVVMSGAVVAEAAPSGTSRKTNAVHNQVRCRRGLNPGDRTKNHRSRYKIRRDSYIVPIQKHLRDIRGKHGEG